MKSLEQRGAPAAEQQEQSNALSKGEKADLRMATATAKQMLLAGGGLKIVEDAIKGSKDPAAVIGQFFATMFAKMHEKFPPELEVSPRIYLAKGGVLEQLLDFLEDKLGMPKEWSDEIFGATVETIKAAAAGPSQSPTPEAEVPGAPAPAPEQAMPQQPAPAQEGMM